MTELTIRTVIVKNKIPKFLIYFRVIKATDVSKFRIRTNLNKHIRFLCESEVSSVWLVFCVKIIGFSNLIQLIVSFKIPSRIYFASHRLKNLLFFGDTDWTTISNIFCTRIIWNRNGLINAVLQKIWHPIIFPNMTNRRHIRIPLYEQKYFNHYTGTGSGKMKL